MKSSYWHEFYSFQFLKAAGNQNLIMTWMKIKIQLIKM